MLRKIKKFFRENRDDFLRLATYAVMLIVAVYAVAFVLSLPEIIGNLICG